MVGLLGGFTTFSTFAWESIDLARHLEMGRLLLGVLGHLALGLLAAWAGWALLRPAG